MVIVKSIRADRKFISFGSHRTMLCSHHMRNSHHKASEGFVIILSLSIKLYIRPLNDCLFSFHVFTHFIPSPQPCDQLSFRGTQISFFQPTELFTNNQLHNTRMSIWPTSFWLCHSKLPRPMKTTTSKSHPVILIEI